MSREIPKGELCGNCPNVFPTEDEQNKIYYKDLRKMWHYCRLYKNARLIHGRFHPDLQKCPACLKEVK